MSVPPPRSKFEEQNSLGRYEVILLFRVIFFSWLVKYPGFKFELLERDPSCLPKEFPNAGNSTCYFLNGYKHPGVDDAEPLETHIKAAMKQINIECGRSMAEVESS